MHIQGATPNALIMAGSIKIYWLYNHTFYGRLARSSVATARLPLYFAESLFIYFCFSLSAETFILVNQPLMLVTNGNLKL